MGIYKLSRTVSSLAVWIKQKRMSVPLRDVRLYVGQVQLLVTLLAFSYGGAYAAKTSQDLDNSLSNLSTAAKIKRAQDQKVIELINVLIAKPQTLVVGNVTVSPSSNTVDLPIIYKAGVGVASLQFDIPFSSKITVNNATLGPAAVSAQKSISKQQDTGKCRVIIFGLNQTSIPSGILAVLSLSLTSGYSGGTIGIENITGSSPSGNPVPVTGKSGSILVN